MSSYPVLDNKPIDQWKVTELKEELKRRKLKTNGLKDDLIRRLYESIQNEVEGAKENVDSGFDSAPKHVVQSQDPMTMPIVDERTSAIMDKNEKRNIELKDDTVQSTVYDDLESLGKEQVLGGDSMVGTDSARLDPKKVIEATTEETSVQVTTVETSVQVTTVETSHQVTTVGSVACERLVTEIALSSQELQNSETQNESEDLNIQPQNEDSNPPHEEAKLNSSDLDNQVFEVSNVTSDSISSDNGPINEKIELKDNIITDDVKLEFDVKPEMEEPSSSNVVPNDGNLQPMDVEEPQENKVKVRETGNNADNPDRAKKINSEDVGLSEKLNLDRSSGDDSLEDDALESKQIEPTSISDEVGDKRKTETIEVPVVREDSPTDAMIDDLNAEKKVENKNGLAVASMKRKLHGQETVENSETTKRQRRWNTEGLKVLETQTATISPSVTPRVFQSTTPRDAFQSTEKRDFSRSDSTASDEMPKERVVPPSPKPPTSSLRIDRFLRPFTLKAVQELLGKTGRVTNFWMDHIKTHCYVSYSSVEEAIETRNAVYNLQWPKNGGRLLVADFVEPQEVQMRLEAPPSAAAPVSTPPVIPPAPVPKQPQPSPRLQVQRQVLPPPLPLPVSPPPPPPLSNPLPARERALPPPSLLPEKVDPPIVTLDDLFRKTKATPRIYYLPLSDEQVAAKQKAQGITTKLSAGVACRNCLHRRCGAVADSLIGFLFFNGLPWVEAEFYF